MEDLLEYIVPAIAFILWIASQFFGKKNESEEQTPRQRPTQHDQDEQARRIQEEIRRKIAERRGQQQPQQREQHSPPPLKDGPPPMRPAQSQQRRYDSPPPIAKPVYESPSAQKDLFAELAKQEERLRDSQRRAEDARRQAQQKLSKYYEQGPQPRRYSSVPRAAMSLREDLIETFRDPMAARRAVLYSEVLGTPVGQRRNGQIRPSWES